MDFFVTCVILFAAKVSNKIRLLFVKIKFFIMHSYYQRVNTVFFTAVYSLAVVSVFYGLLYVLWILPTNTVGELPHLSRESFLDLIMLL